MDLFPDLKAIEKKQTFVVTPKINSLWLPPKEFPDLSNAQYISLDTETYDPELTKHGPGHTKGRGHIVGVSLAVEDKAWYFPIRHEFDTHLNLDEDKVLAYLKDVLSNPAQPKLGANLMYDIGWLRTEGIKVAGQFYDVQFAESLLKEEGEVNLDYLGLKYTGVGKDYNEMDRWASKVYKTKNARSVIYKLSPAMVGPYAERDALLPIKILNEQYPTLEKEDLLRVFDLENRLINPLLDMMFVGTAVDLDKAERVSNQLAIEIKEDKKIIKDKTGIDINVNASKSVASLFKYLNIPYYKTSTGAASFTEEFLKSIDHELVQLVLRIRKLDKLKSTFIDSYILEKNVNGRVYTQFHPLRDDENGTRSGRLASSGPNLQNLPARDKKLGPLIRGIFIPDDYHKQWRKIDQCVSPETKILTYDLKWVNADQIQPGQYVIAFDEEKQYKEFDINKVGRNSNRGRRYLHKSRVLAVTVVSEPTYKIVTDKTVIICSESHRWLARKKYNTAATWIETNRLSVGNEIFRAVDLWGRLAQNYEIGWLAGIFDGEGWIDRKGRIIGIAQNPGEVLDRVKFLLEKYRFPFIEANQHHGFNPLSDVRSVRILGGRTHFWRFLDQVHPIRLFNKVINDYNNYIEGVALQTRMETDTILKIEYIGEQKLIGLKTEHGTYIANGLCSHNSQMEFRYLMHYAIGPKADEVRNEYRVNPKTDYHEVVRQTVFKETGKLIERTPTKNINFGLIYGMMQAKLARQLGVELEEAQSLFNVYHHGVPFVAETMSATMQEASRLGYITTILGRRSRFDYWVPIFKALRRDLAEHFYADYDLVCVSEEKDTWRPKHKPMPLYLETAKLEYPGFPLKRAEIHKALNRRLQGSNADHMKLTIVEAYEAGVFDVTGIPRLTVHDELDFSDKGDTEEAYDELLNIMYTCIDLRVPVLANTAIGPNWGEVKEIK